MSQVAEWMGLQNWKYCPYPFNYEFSNFCNEHGIFHEFFALKTLQQNGVIEKDKVVQDMARVMLVSNKTPVKFWAVAVNTAVYIINRVYLRPSTKQTPYELC